jgi:hypothetical protein
VIGIARPSLPDQLQIRLTDLTQEIAQADETSRAAGARTTWKRASVRTNVRAPLGQILRQMAPGREHCMYCGDSQGTSIDHYEPIARNPLRTFDWLNHLLACSVCNSHEKRDRFPLDLDGRPLLIDPTSEDPFEHLLLTLSLGIYYATSDKGQATIDICGLNRAILVRGRVQARRVVDICLAEWGKANNNGDGAAKDQAVLTVREQPFADVCQSMLRQSAAPGAEDIFADSPSVLALLRLPELRTALLA